MSFSMRTLLVFMAGAAVVTASLVYPTPAIGDLFYTAGLTGIGLSILAAVYSRGPNRAYWIGFTVLFAGYFCHSIWPSEVRGTLNLMQRWGRTGVFAQGLITSRMLERLYELLHGPLTAFGPPMTGPSRSGQMATALEQYTSFLTVGHTAIAIVFGAMGGTIARLFAARALTRDDAVKENL